MTVSRHHASWRFDFWKNGQRYKKSGFSTKQEARTAESDFRKTLRRTNTGFIKLCESRLEELELKRTKQHFKENQKLIKRLIPLWATKREITREDIEKYINQIARESGTKANKELKWISALFGHGVKKRWLLYNPASGIERFPVGKSRRYVPPQEDIIKVLERADEEQRRYLLVIIYTMARVREINRLTWQDITPNFLILRTRKSKHSDIVERKIHLNPSLKKILDSIPKTGLYVFMNKRSKKNYDYRKKLLKRLCEKAGVPYFTFHCLRHFGASFLASQGTPITDIQTLLGHQRATTTDLYLRSLGYGLTEATGMLEVISPPGFTPNPEEEKKSE